MNSLRIAVVLFVVVMETIVAWTPSSQLITSDQNILSGYEQVTTSRRRILAAGSSLAGSFAFFGGQHPCWAAAPLDAGEAIRRGAANIPGYGSTDVFYPESFAGSWKATREVEFPSGTRIQLQYPIRFIRSIEDDAVVADRGYNQAELEAALVTQTSSGGNIDEKSVVQSYEWLPNNPNVLKVALSNGTKKEIKVTKRATERTEETVTSSEFQRVTQEQDTSQPGGGIPVISARRVVSKWKQVDNNRLEGLEIVYSMGGMAGDPLAVATGGGASQTTVLSKSRIVLTR